MDINTWLTVVTIFIGVITVLPKEERTLLQLKLHKAELLVFFALLFIAIPYLIFFPQVVGRWPWFRRFTIKEGFNPTNIAFGIFYGLFIWIVVRFLVIRPVGRVNGKIIDYFKNALTELPFPQFFSLFTKYSSPTLQKRDWHLYQEIILQPEFLQGMSKHRPAYVNNLWELLDESDFKIVLKPFLTDTTSVYYEETKANDGSYTVLRNLPFLNSILVKNLLINRENGLLYLISDFSKEQLRAEKGKMHSIYLQSHYYQHTKGEEGYDLPVFYHIRFIALMYSTAITNKVDTYPHMHTLFEGMIDEMLTNLNVEIGNRDEEYPTNYHWLIGEIFSSASHWLNLFGSEHVKPGNDAMPESDYIYFKKESTYIDFIPSCLGNCLRSLYKGVKENKINIKFVARMMYYSVLSEYFSHNLKNELRASIEENVIKNIPNEYVEQILDLALDERFAGDFSQFQNKCFSSVHKEEVEVQLRLWNYMKSHQLI
ncbi:hypothetical protein [Pseudoflavitalea rhizosphaerae]|uniref:hypothetical protein n=1 Tax=Pseudoflavitalea rhizosphaerae TaxID=1884793 RepID=UPI000F8C8A34|nr:hypothetical protein [Pseudoflavitalea rhizosphaerae]